MFEHLKTILDVIVKNRDAKEVSGILCQEILDTMHSSKNAITFEEYMTLMRIYCPE